MLVGYARTSTLEQEAGLEAQHRDLSAAGCTKTFSEQVSSVATRQELAKAMEFVREGDTLVVTKVDRLARSAFHLLDIARDLERRGVGLRILHLGGDSIDTTSANGRLILTIFAGFAQFERELMLERQREGIAKAKAAGRYKGRKPTARAKASDVLRLHSEGRTPTEIARQLEIGRGSVYRIIAPASQAVSSNAG
jgi:DNA invertase Pin-like site-specific DNA recombinase